ncbi:MAG TPA: hypothetical protein VK177_19375 [Flavobacteriales bacterium]|nr:hypothetical protein [Flavobacteriales bacterium]
MTYNDFLKHKLEHNQAIENVIRGILKVDGFGYGGKVIRDDRGFRENEKFMEYFHQVNITMNAGSVTLFSAKFKESKFRTTLNLEELLTGIIALNTQNNLPLKHVESSSTDFNDPIREIPKFDLFEKDDSITLDGIHYELLIYASGAKTFIDFGNPHGPAWSDVEKRIWTLGRKLAVNSNIDFFKAFFTV